MVMSVSKYIKQSSKFWADHKISNNRAHNSKLLISVPSLYPVLIVNYFRIRCLLNDYMFLIKELHLSSLFSCLRLWLHCPIQSDIQEQPAKLCQLKRMKCLSLQISEQMIWGPWGVWYNLKSTFLSCCFLLLDCLALHRPEMMVLWPVI